MMKIIKYLLAAVLLVGQVSCVDKKFEDEFKISVTPDAVISKLELNIVDAKPNGDNENEPLETAKISFSSADADKLFTNGGTKAVDNSFTITNGHIVLGVKSSEGVDELNPLTVSGTIESEGYLNLPVELTFTGEDVVSLQLNLNKENDMPNGVSFDKMTISAGDIVDNKTAKEITSVVTTATTDLNGETVEEEIEMIIPADTGFLDENGNLVETSEVELQVQTFSPAGVEGDGFPGDLGIDDATATDPLTRISSVERTSSTNNFIYAAGNIVIPVTNLYCMYGYARSVYLANCTRKTIVKNYFYQRGTSIKNPITGEDVKVGDLIDVYHRRSRYSSTTSFLTKASVKFDSRRNRFYAEFETDRFGIYPMGFTLTNSGCNPSSFNGVTLTNSGSPGSYRFIVYNENLPSRYVAYGRFYLSDSKTITARDLRYNYYFRRLRMLSAPNLKLRIDAYSYDQGQYVTLYDQKTTVCDLDGGSIELTHPDCRERVDLDLNITCPDVNISLNYSSIYYKPAASRSWRRYGYISRGYVRAYAPCLEANENYKFAVWYNGWKESPEVKGSDVTNAIDLQPSVICDQLPQLD